MRRVPRPDTTHFCLPILPLSSVQYVFHYPASFHESRMIPYLFRAAQVANISTSPLRIHRAVISPAKSSINRYSSRPLFQDRASFPPRTITALLRRKSKWMGHRHILLRGCILCPAVGGRRDPALLPADTDARGDESENSLLHADLQEDTETIQLGPRKWHVCWTGGKSN